MLAAARVEAPLREPVGSILDSAAERSPRLVEPFLTRIPGQLDAIQSAIEAGAEGQLRQVAHKMKGSCLALGAPQLAESCERLEQQPKGRPERLLAQVRKAFEQVAVLLAKEQPETYAKARELRPSILPPAA